MVPQNHRLRKVRSEGSSGSRLLPASMTHTATLGLPSCTAHMRIACSIHRTQDTHRRMA